MRYLVRFFGWLYTQGLNLYPSDFREDFGDEMENVFRLTALSGAQDSWRSLIKCFYLELKDYPASVLREYVQSRRTKMTETSDQFTPIRPAELLAALTIFLIPIIFSLLVTVVGVVNLNTLPNWLDMSLKIFFVGSLIAAFGFAIIRGLPRWSPPYLGFLIVTWLLLDPFLPMKRLWEWAYPHIIRGLGQMRTWSMLERALYQGVQEAFLWSFVLLIAVILITLLRLLPYTRSLWRRVREDWTQLSFLVYGGIVFYILFIFDEYRQTEFWSLASWIILAIGCLLYLYSKEKYQRIFILLCGATLAMWIVAVGKWFLFPIQDWGPIWKPPPPETERWFEFYQTMAGWIIIVIALLSPALLNLLPKKLKTGLEDEHLLA